MKSVSAAERRLLDACGTVQGMIVAYFKIVLNLPCWRWLSRQGRRDRSLHDRIVTTAVRSLRALCPAVVAARRGHRKAEECRAVPLPDFAYCGPAVSAGGCGVIDAGAVFMFTVHSELSGLCQRSSVKAPPHVFRRGRTA